MALKRLEISNELSSLPEEDLERVRSFVDAILGTKALERKPQSLRGIWQDQGFEEIVDLESALKEVRKDLAASILDRRL